MRLFFTNKKIFILIFISILISLHATAEPKPSDGKKFVYLAGLNHPYTNFRLSYAFAHMAFDYYTAIETLNAVQGDLVDSTYIILAGVVPLGITSVIFSVVGFTKIADYQFLEPTLSIREDKNIIKLDTGLTTATYLGGKGGKYSAGAYGQYVNLSYLRKKILYYKPIGLSYHFLVDSKLQKLTYDNTTEESTLQIIGSPFNWGAQLRDDSFWKNAEISIETGPDILMSNFYAEKNFIVSSIPLYKGLGINTICDLTLPLFKSIALAGTFRYSYFFSLYKDSSGTQSYSTYNDFENNSTFSMLRYYIKLKILGGYITPEFFFSQEFLTGDKLTRIDDMTFGASLSLLF